nr:UBP-type zinc finger domain-containing protein [Candidatus Nitrosocosmicus franklandus]
MSKNDEFSKIPCEHIKLVDMDKNGNTTGCEECEKIRDKWVHLRVCLSCGKVGCCDNSKNKHATKHFKNTNHPMIRSYEPNEYWKWCYVDELLID